MKIVELLKEQCTRNDIVPYYADLIRDTPPDSLSFKVINHAIKQKWSAAGLNYIKAKAWQMLKREKESYLQAYSLIK